MVSVKVIPGLFIVGGSQLTYYEDDNSYLLLSDPPILIDIGTEYGIQNLILNILELGCRPTNIKYLVITHAHKWNAGGCAIFKEFSLCNVISHKPDSYLLRNPPDDEDYRYRPCVSTIELDVDRWKLDIQNFIVEILHTPGHTMGSLSVLIENSRFRVVVVGGLLDPLSSRWKSSHDEWVKSLTKVKNLEPDVLCYSKGCIYGKTNVSKLLEDMISKGPVWV